MPRKKVETENEQIPVVGEMEPQQIEEMEESLPADEIAADAIVGAEDKDVPAEPESEEDVVKTNNKVTPSQLTDSDVQQFYKESVTEDAFWADTFSMRTVTVPSRRKQADTFREDNVIIGDESGEIDTYAKLRKIEYDLLTESAKSMPPKPLYGRVVGIEVMAGPMGKEMPMAVCQLITDNRKDINTDREIKSAIYKIKIPANMFFIYNQTQFNVDTEEGMRALRRAMDKRIGAVVEFVVYDVNPSEIDVIASRLSAMRSISYDWYLKEGALIKPGVCAKGYINYLSQNGAVVDVMGADIFIPRSELCWRYVSNALDERTQFKLGSAVPVKILSVEKASVEIFGRKQPYLKVKGSVKDAKPNPNEKFFENYIVGQKYCGRVAARLVTGEYIVNLGVEGQGISGDSATCICKPPEYALSGSIRTGQKCSVAITAKNASDFRLRGAFAYIGD